MQTYNQEIKNGVSPMTAYYRTMQSASKSAVKMAENAKGATVDINKLNTSSKAAALGMKALSIAGNMLLMYAITKAISLVVNAIDDYVHRLDNAREQLEETRSELETVNSELEKRLGLGSQPNVILLL